jgi:hypothetical protein
VSHLLSASPRQPFHGGTDSFSVHWPVDKRLRDEVLLAELEMTTNLMIAANQSDGPLTQDQVNAALGLPCPDAGPPC